MSYCFSDRYDVVHIVYESATTVAALVSSKKDDALYLMKCVRKHAAASPTNFLEADLLRKLSHPGIPRLIDTYEDREHYVIVEEYFCGETLEQYLLCHQHISQDTLVSFAIQICEIIQYLHCRRPDPILYLDLKPAHTIVCGNTINLIDYGNANILSSSGNTFQNFGTKSFAAPEQKKGRDLDRRADVYAIGRMLRFMAGYAPFLTRLKLFPLIFCATRRNRNRRTAEVGILLRRLRKWEKKTKKGKEQKHLLTTVAVVGSEHGVGCTHIAIALVCYLNRAGFFAYYRNETDQPVAERILRADAACEQKDGYIYHDTFRGILSYGPAVEPSPPPEGIQVVDLGCQKEKPEAGATIYVCGGRIWQRPEERPAWTKDSGVIPLCNQCSVFEARYLAAEWERGLYRFPYHKDAFVVTAAVGYLFSRMIRKEIFP